MIYVIAIPVLLVIGLLIWVVVNMVRSDQQRKRQEALESSHEQSASENQAETSAELRR